MVSSGFLWCGMGGNRSDDSWIVGFRQPSFGKPSLQRLLCAKTARRVRAVTMADAIVCAGNVVKENCGPETSTVLRLPGGFDKANGVNHHASNVRLAMQVARVPEEVGQWNDAIGRKRNEKLAHSRRGKDRRLAFIELRSRSALPKSVRCLA